MWAAVTVTMSVLGWVVARWLADHLSTRDPFIDCPADLLRRRARADARARRRPGAAGAGVAALAATSVTGCGCGRRGPEERRRGGRVWWWVVPVHPAVGGDQRGWGSTPTGRCRATSRWRWRRTGSTDYFHANWWGFALRRGERAARADRRGDRVQGLPAAALARRPSAAATSWHNGVLFTLYHLHQPWSMPAVLLDGTLTAAYPTRGTGARGSPSSRTRRRACSSSAWC